MTIKEGGDAVGDWQMFDLATHRGATEFAKYSARRTGDFRAVIDRSLSGMTVCVRGDDVRLSPSAFADFQGYAEQIRADDPTSRRSHERN